jgi:hypothetical protein
MSTGRRAVTLVGLALGLLCTGCAAQRQPMYAWGNYSDSLYQTKKNETPETAEQHVQALERIITESNSRNLRVPPGVYGELGYVYASRNNPGKAIELFRLEKQTYPESALLMDRLISRAEKAAAPVSEPPAVSAAEHAVKQETAIGGGAAK